jgi:predicted dehydrogenase
MLSKAETGGSALINLGIHGFDLCRYLTGEAQSRRRRD